MTSLITGGSGLVGQQLLRHLERVVATSRSAARLKQKLGPKIDCAIEWDPLAQELDLSPAPPIDTVVNLMGEPIAEGRWTATKKKSIRDSRVIGTQKLVTAILAQPTRPSVFVTASAVGFYGSRGDEELTESSGPGTGFLAEVCQEWEDASRPLEDHGIRVVRVRLGIVLSRQGGALVEMLKPFKMGVGGPLGTGKQFFPWVHIDDVVGIFRQAIADPAVEGTVNAVAPGIVTNRQWTQALGKAVGRPAMIPVPKFALQLLVGEFADSLFYSQRVIPQVMMANGYQFQYPDLPSCLENLVS